MLKGNTDNYKQCLMEKNYDELHKINLRKPGVRDDLVDMFPKLFEKKVMRTGPDGIVAERIERDYSLPLAAVIEVLKKNRRSLNL